MRVALAVGAVRTRQDTVAALAVGAVRVRQDMTGACLFASFALVKRRKKASQRPHRDTSEQCRQASLIHVQ